MDDDLLKGVRRIRPQSEIGLADPEGQLPGGALGLSSVFANAIRGWHGSPYKFDKFEWTPETRGSGEGGAAFGEGTYIGEARGTGEAYRDIARRRHPSSVVMPDGTLIPQGKMTTAQALAAGATQWSGDPVSNLSKLPTNSLYTRDVIDEALGLIRQGVGYRQAGHLYEVDIHADPKKFLNLDTPLAEQGPSVQHGVEQFIRDNPDVASDMGAKSASDAMREILGSGQKGSDVYMGLGDTLGSSVAVSQGLNKAGIPGNRFWDKVSREQGGGTSNFVVFDPRIIKIVSVMGIAGALGAGLISQEIADQMRSQGVEG